MTSEPIVFLDFPSSDKLGRKPWNPNTWKTRYVLNYKGLNFTTQWVEYPDVEAECKKIGAAPTAKKPDGQDYYTLPTIYDPNTKKAVSDSWNIAKYLDEAYPDTPTMFFEGTDAFQAVFHDFLWTSLAMPVFCTVIADMAKSMNPRSAEYFRATREAAFGAKLEDLQTEESWVKAEGIFGKLNEFLEKNGSGKDLLLMGDKISYSDIQVASLLNALRTAHGEDSVGWKRFASWHGGKWGKFLTQFSQWES